MTYLESVKIISDITANKAFMLIEKSVLETMSGNCSKAVQKVVNDFLTNDFDCEHISYISAMADDPINWAVSTSKQAIIAFAKELAIYAEIIAEQNDKVLQLTLETARGMLSRSHSWSNVMFRFQRAIIKKYSNCGRCIDVNLCGYFFTIRDEPFKLYTIETCKPDTITKHDLFMMQAPSFNFELSEDEILTQALKVGYIFKVKSIPDAYVINHNYKRGSK